MEDGRWSDRLAVYTAHGEPYAALVGPVLDWAYQSPRDDAPAAAFISNYRFCDLCSTTRSWALGDVGDLGTQQRSVVYAAAYIPIAGARDPADAGPLQTAAHRVGTNAHSRSNL